VRREEKQVEGDAEGRRHERYAHLRAAEAKKERSGDGGDEQVAEAHGRRSERRHLELGQVGRGRGSHQDGVGRLE
jgi:hypothetical protein